MWLTELRRQGHRQTTGWAVGRGRGRKVCALQLLWEVGGRPKYAPGFYNAIGARAGLSPRQTWTVVRMNDGMADYRRHTFAEIADVVASWFSGSPISPGLRDEKAPPRSDCVEHLGTIDEDDPEVRWSPTYEYMSAMGNILDQLKGKNKAEEQEMVFAEMGRLGWT
jgi:hypothetical protein